MADWTPVTPASVPPRDAHSASVLIFSGSAETGRFQVDDVSLREWSLQELGSSGVAPNLGFEVDATDDEVTPG